MSHSSQKLTRKLGLTPGALVYVGLDRTSKVTIDAMEYDATALREYRIERFDEWQLSPAPETVTWINIEGVHDLNVVEAIGKRFGIHPLLLEDIVNTTKRPKFEDYSDYVVLMLRMLYVEPRTGQIVSEQVSLVIGKSFVISFQEVEGDVFDPIRERIRKTVPRQRFIATDYLAHALIDAVVDHYFVVLERLGERVDAVEKRLIRAPRPENMSTIYDLKRMFIEMRRAVWPLREALSAMERADCKLIQDASRPYFRDLYEHVVQVMDTVESQRETVASLLDLYLSSINNKTNEVMKLLTIIATIFIPLTFLAGVYGMNFDTAAGPFNMPELLWPYGYVLFWVVSLAISAGLIWYFRRRHWL